MYKVWTALFTLLLLSGCVLGPTGSEGNFTVLGPKGNGEGYGGNREKVVRTAYRVDPDFRCSDGSAPGYQSQIEVRGDDSLFVRDACGGQARPIAARTDALGDQLLGYEADVYEFRSEPPSVSKDETFAMAWCWVIGNPDLGYVLTSTTQSKQSRVKVYQRENGVVDFTDPFVYRSWAEVGYRFLVSEIVQAGVRVTRDSVERNFYLGKMRFESEEHFTACRLNLSAF